jgi:pimeloyl-ACP methyl ester carboxylesterase
MAGHRKAASRAPVPPPECVAPVGYDRDRPVPGYILPTAAGPRTCVPFTTTRETPPEGYRGDFYVDEFTDQKLRHRWRECEEREACHRRVFDQVMKRHPPNREYGLADPHAIYLLGKAPQGEVDLKTIRRPAFFAAAPWNEPFAALEPDTFTVEFTAPVEAYERLHEHMTGEIRLRGWYIRGAGVEAGQGRRVRALVVMSGGGGCRIAAIDDPADRLYRVDPKTGATTLNEYPNARTGAQGQAQWRRLGQAFHDAGYDVLMFDRRGVGVSGGFSDTNTLQQGRDLLAILASLRTGQGLRALSPAGELTAGPAAAQAVRGGPAARGLPTLLMGSSRGTMSSGWAMTLNFDRDCAYDLPKITCGPPVRDPTVKGAILVSEFSSGVGYVPAETTPVDDGRGPGRDRGLFIGGIEEEHHIVFFPSSAILAGTARWPSAFFARGLWDYAASLEGTMDAYSRVKGLKELVVVRAPHPFETWPAEEKARVQARMLAYARAVVLGEKSLSGGRPWSDAKALVATAGDVWEPSTRPTVLP